MIPGAPTLPAGFLDRPFAHRALHGPGTAENSEEAIDAASRGRWGIEIDVQLTADGQAAVFHDDHLRRLTGRPGRVRDLTMNELWHTPLLGGGTIPDLGTALMFAERRPVLIEIKDQSGDLSADGIAPLAEAVSTALVMHRGPVAVMSFNPHAVAAMAELRPDIPRGLVTCAFAADEWPTLLTARRHALREMADLDAVGATFISHDRRDLASPAVAAARASGRAILTWTIRSPSEEAAARPHADQITFEGYVPDAPRPTG